MTENQSNEEPEITEAGEVEADEDELDQVAGGLSLDKAQLDSSQRFGRIVRKKTGGDDTSHVLGKGPVPS